MTNAELAILSLVAEKPRHGYDIEQVIEARGMREWTEIGFSSIYYLLNKSEDRGWVLSTLGESSKGPVRKLYALTQTGWALLRTELLQRLSNPIPKSGEFDLALAFMSILPPKQVTDALAKHQQSLEDGLMRVNQQWERSGKGHLPENVEILFAHSLHRIQSELDWVKTLLHTRKEK